MRKFLFPCIALLAFCADASGKTEVIIPDGYSNVVFQDEFDTDGMPDNGKWGYEQGYVRNGELQYYAAARKENTYIKNGNLHIVARNDSAAIDGEMRPVSSASLTTQGKHSWRYCYVEVRAKLPSCLGSWPAIWMMPEKSVYGDWPKSGEIDIMEHVGYAPENVHYAAHSEKYNHVKGVQKNRAVPCANVDGEYHIYALEWKEDSLTWILDGKPMFTLDKENGADWESWPFDQNFYLILNFAFGGGWGGQQGVDRSALPQEYLIDYVRIFQ